jgi:hypothetical protein
MGLEDLGLPALIVDAKRAKVVFSCRLNKTDANDAFDNREYKVTRSKTIAS